MAGPAGTGRLTAGYAAAAGTVLALLAGAALALTRAILRPLREAAELAESAGQAADERLPHVIARRSVHPGAEGSHWPLGMTLMRMPDQLRASRTAEAAARRSADEMSQHLGETTSELLRSVNVVRGSAQHYQQQPEPGAARLDRMMRRVAEEAAHMETLIEGLEAPPTGPARPDLRATCHAAPTRQPGRGMTSLHAIASGYWAAKIHR